MRRGRERPNRALRIVLRRHENPDTDEQPCNGSGLNVANLFAIEDRICPCCKLAIARAAVRP